MTKQKKQTKKSQKTAKTPSKIRVFTNDYGVEMAEITAGPRNQFVSLKKIRDVLRTNTDPELIKETTYKGRSNMFEIQRLEGKPMYMGENKINAILDNAVELTDAVAKAGL